MPKNTNKNKEKLTKQSKGLPVMAAGHEETQLSSAEAPAQP